MLCSSLSRHRFNGLSLACSGSNYFELSADTGMDMTFPSRKKVLKESMEAYGRAMPWWSCFIRCWRWLLILFGQPRETTVPKEDPTELSTSRLTDGTNSNRDSLPYIVGKKSHSGTDNEQHLPSHSQQLLTSFFFFLFFFYSSAQQEGVNCTSLDQKSCRYPLVLHLFNKILHDALNAWRFVHMDVCLGLTAVSKCHGSYPQAVGAWWLFLWPSGIGLFNHNDVFNSGLCQ